MISSIFFNDMITVPDGRFSGGGQPRSDLREASFHARDGWEIRESIPGVFTLWIDGMAEPVTVGGYGYTLVRQRVEESSDADEKPSRARVSVGKQARRRAEVRSRDAKGEEASEACADKE